MNDIFISYAHLDDQSIDEDQKGWISKFHRVLEIKLSQVSTDHAKVGAAQASLEAESERLTAARSSLTSAGSRITNLSYAHTVTKKSAAQVHNSRWLLLSLLTSQLIPRLRCSLPLISAKKKLAPRCRLATVFPLFPTTKGTLS